jgi:lysophospholipase L1-like esterase
MKRQLIFCTFCVLFSCAKRPVPSVNPIINPSNAMLTYLALGDSYTIGESVSQHESFPYQLVAQLNANKSVMGTPKIIARTGWTTDELQAAIKTDNGINPPYSIVTLLIGVNNQYRGNSIDTYRKEFKELLQTAISFAGSNKAHVFVVSIPDWGATTFGKSSGRDQKTIAKEIDNFNVVNREETLAMGVSYTDITSDSRNAATDGALIAGDGLHPSGKMYAQWAAALAPKVAASY